MSNQFESQNRKPKSLGLRRPLAGALIGSLIFLLILLPLKFLPYNSVLLYILALNLELLGRLTIIILGMTAKIDWSPILLNLVSITVSTIPAGIAGSQISSLQQSTRKAGIIFLTAYLVFIFACGAVLTVIGI
jgi:hypothetical protein